MSKVAFSKKAVFAALGAVALALSTPLAANAETEASAPSKSITIDNVQEGKSNKIGDRFQVSTKQEIQLKGSGPHTIRVTGKNFNAVTNTGEPLPGLFEGLRNHVGVYVGFAKDLTNEEARTRRDLFQKAIWLRVPEALGATPANTIPKEMSVGFDVDLEVNSRISDTETCWGSRDDLGKPGIVACYLYTSGAFGSMNPVNDNKIPVFFE